MTKVHFILFLALILCFSLIGKTQVLELEEDTLIKDKVKKADSNLTKVKGVEDINRIDCLNIQPSNNTFVEGNLEINLNEEIEKLSLQYMEEKKIIGYKIQIFSGHSRWEASKMRSDFITEHTSYPVPDLIYQSPNFKLRVGNYKNRFEAEKDLVKLKEYVSSAFIIKDEIDIKLEGN